MARGMLQNPALGMNHMPFRCITKKRVVWCVHIAAFLFSVLVLSVSAFSYYRWITLNWTSGPNDTDNEIHFDEGHIVVVRYFDTRWNRPFDVSIRNPEPIREVTEIYEHVSHYNDPMYEIQTSFLSARYSAATWDNGTPHSMQVSVPLWYFLWPSMAWMCLFYRVKLRQYIRTRLAGRQIAAENRIVRSIQIAAFITCILILSISTFSHYRAIMLSWSSGPKNTHNLIQVNEGDLIVTRHHDLELEVSFAWFLDEPRSTHFSVIEDFEEFSVVHGFQFVIRYMAKIRKNGSIDASLTVVPLRRFLILPVLWMCGFYFFRLRRLVRVLRAERKALERTG